MLPHAVPLDAYRSTAGPAGCASLTAQGSLPRQKVQLRRRFSTPPAVGYAVCNDLRCEHMPHRSMRARYMREPSSHGLQATGRLRVSNHTRHATTPRATVLAPSGTGSALEGHSSGTAHVLYRTSCPLRVPRRCWPRRLRPKASKRRAAARKYAAPTPSSQDCLPSALELCSRQRKAAALYVCATLPPAAHAALLPRHKACYSAALRRTCDEQLQPVCRTPSPRPASPQGEALTHEVTIIAVCAAADWMR